jgi:predicted MFS family arabinose efflux permease
VASVGEAGCFWINAASFVAVLGGLLAIRTRRGAGGARDGDGAGSAPSTAMASTLREGLAYAWSTPGIRNLLVLLSVCAGLGFQYNTLLPVYARDILHSGPEAYGLLFSAFGAGSLAAALRMTAAHDRWALRRHLLFGLIAAGLGLGGFAWARWMPAMAACAALAGFGLILYVSSTNTLIQLTVDDRFRGRVMSLYTLSFVGTSPFGSLLAGGVAQRWGAPMATSLCALILLGGALWVSVRLRAIAAREAAGRPPAPEPEPTG